MWLFIRTLVQHKKARFDTKLHGPTQKCPVRHKKGPTQHASVASDIIKIHPPLEFFFQFYAYILFLRTHREIKMKLYWHWNIFNVNIVMIIMSTAMNKCYQYGSTILPTFAFSFYCSIKFWHARGYTDSIMHLTRTFVITISENRLSHRPHLEQKLCCRCNSYTSALLPDCRWPVLRHARNNWICWQKRQWQ